MWPKKIIDFFLFSGIFVSLGSVMMCMGTTVFLLNQLPDRNFLAFVFFSTMCSYNLHWYLSRDAQTNGERLQWSQQNSYLQGFLFLLGLFGSAFFALFLLKFWLWIGVAAFLTFLYTAPKIPLGQFKRLKNIAYGKTFYLSMVWMYVTCILPLIVKSAQWNPDFIWFILSRFFLIYANCILFDFRDREEDLKEGIRSLITYLNERGIDKLFYFSIMLFLFFGLMTKGRECVWEKTATLIFPGILLAGLYRYFKQNFSDYTYYFLLDGLVILSSVLLISLNLFH